MSFLLHIYWTRRLVKATLSYFLPSQKLSLSKEKGVLLFCFPFWNLFIYELKMQKSIKSSTKAQCSRGRETKALLCLWFFLPDQKLLKEFLFYIKGSKSVNHKFHLLVSSTGKKLIEIYTEMYKTSAKTTATLLKSGVIWRHELHTSKP